ISLSDWVLGGENRRNAGRACAVTFDDGWRDNYQFALPVLVETRTPATVFLVSDLIGTDRLFWPNRLARLLAWLGERATHDPSLEWLRKLGAMPAGFDGSRGQISKIIAACKRLTDREIEHEVEQSERA